MAARPRTGPERKADVLAKLEAENADAWVATASPSGAAHLVPLSYAWDGRHVILATEPKLLTARNIEASGHARLGFGPTRDVVIVDAQLDKRMDVHGAPEELADAYARQSGWDPRLQRDPFIFLLLRLRRVQAWREANEVAGRTLMRDGVWLP
ncbi:MAG: pyridoxamine 5'-phosphate oxidase family protein [Candidatus Limnocylindrales bacterium]